MRRDSSLLPNLAVLSALWLAALTIPASWGDPWHLSSPRAFLLVAAIVFSISLLASVAKRAMGPRHGLPLAGLVGGFISSTATIGSMGQLCQRQPELSSAATAGAALSTIATFVQMGLLLWAVDRPLFTLMFPALLAGGCMAIVYSLFFFRHVKQQPDATLAPPTAALQRLRSVLLFALLVTVISATARLAQLLLGESGVLLTAALAGLADAHTGALSAALLSAREELARPLAATAVLLAITSNTLSKAFLAASVGKQRFAARIIPGLLLVCAAAWLAAILPI